MKEDFLQYVWKYGLLKTNILRTNNGEKIEVLDFGLINTDAGPDFFNAKVKTGSVLWVGNIEIHLRGSDWYRHNHHIDPAYDNVILHVVEIDDREAYSSSGRLIPTVKISYVDELVFEYESLCKSRKKIPCIHRVNELDSLTIAGWLNKLVVERLQSKTEGILNLYKYNNNSWEETFYQIVARYFGLNVNSFPFELLAKSTPLKVLLKNKDSEIAIEAMLFGQAGMLSGEKGDTYYSSLKKEYEFYKKKYCLKPLSGDLWKYLRLRPSNFPEIRVAQFANLIYKSDPLFSKVIECESLSQLYSLFDTRASSYWNRHYSFNKSSVSQVKNMGKSSIDIIIINAVIPIIFAYGISHDMQKIKDRAFDWLEKLKAEGNRIVLQWKDAGVKVNSALESQALIQLEKNYCDRRKCLSCDFGNKLLRKNI